MRIFNTTILTLFSFYILFLKDFIFYFYYYYFKINICYKQIRYNIFIIFYQKIIIIIILKHKIKIKYFFFKLSFLLNYIWIIFFFDIFFYKF